MAWTALLALLHAAPLWAQTSVRTNLVAAILSEDVAEQIEWVKHFAETNDPLVEQALTAWRGGALFVLETNETRTPFLLEPATDADGKAKAIGLADGKPLVDGDGQLLAFAPAELTPADTTSKLRQAIKMTLDQFALGHPNAKARRDAAVKLGQEQTAEFLPRLMGQLGQEKDPEVRRALVEAVALTQSVSTDPAVRVPALTQLGAMRSINALNFLRRLDKEAQLDPARFDRETIAAARVAMARIETYVWWGSLFGTAFRGLSLAAVLLVAALGLAITFGLMGVINMAHGELIMVGAYTAYVTQNIFADWFGAGSPGFHCYFAAALISSFTVAGLVGLVLERGVIRFLYKRQLESLLATWGVSLVLQQCIRHLFGAANVRVTSPNWLSGSFVINDVLLAFNRLFVIGFALCIVAGTYLLLTRTPLGLQIRGVMQNRAMASALGVRTDRVNMVTFAFGSGLAGMAGACLSQIGNVGPSLGQYHIVDCFMIVVLGGVGSLAGTITASLGVGMTDQVLQPWLGAVMGKITVLAIIILFLQWRPAGLFVARSRSLEG